MIKSTVDPACTGQFSPLFLDYIRQKPETFSFYNQYPEISNFENLIKGKNFSLSNRQILVDSLKKQYAGFEGDALIMEQISSLSDSKTFTVTTGHQLNLFTGPLYFIYKIVATINLAERLKKAYPDCHFVPVYWMATEDHDFEEINYFKLNGKKYQWKSPQKGAVGDFKLDETFRGFFQQVAFFVPDFFKEAYQKSEKLSEAVRKYVHHLFGDKGLIVVDGNDANLKRLFIPVIKEDLVNQAPSRFASDQSSKLDDLGYKSQIYPRDINLFYMVDGLRERIEKSDSIYKVLNTAVSFSENEILEELDLHPERFSPNVVLRPLYQEMILPNLAYLGGPAEVIYWLQLKSMFDHFEVQFPAIMPRNFALVLDTVASRKINQLGLKDEELFKTVLDWKKAFVLNHAVVDFQFEQEKESMSRIFEQTGQKASELEKSLGNAFEAGKVRALKIMDQLSKKVRKAEERRQSVQIRRREDIQELLFPGGSPQERVENFMKFYLEAPDFLDELFELFDPFDFNYIILKSENG
ncbi:bacillithiol biosynthesis cysteine-adding enzyme BshC [Aquiflexum balticum DSM 16537]|uniref:Putative cysteine ligase BshC n=1 Tax=Aquiflexum balticum DSM 16537 TaxID=758820 RepID=A0A1W2GZS2_9BACT|nr:bacillithiol biosynthesis cysteine-adding enzyme BshC [Aquiflexum balticum]SMD41882.1 bacillithiol biosynthesis cysteine-adding enzyme BshC [Aquiflexum balticum DSM 16537]